MVDDVITRDGVVVWFLGRPAAGKTTLADAVRRRLVDRGAPVCVLDGDEVCAALVPTPGTTPEQRECFYATLGGLAALLAHQGLIVLVAATAHRRAFRSAARARAPRYLEVYVSATREECEGRDPKHLYADVTAGAAHGLPGVDLAFEAPARPDVIAVGGHDDDAVDRVLAVIDDPGRCRSWLRGVAASP